jgi:HEAT repeat protein
MRARALVAVALLGAAVLLYSLWKRGEPPPPAPPADPRASDVRLAELLEPCVQGGFYDKAVSDVVPILIEKLQRGGGEPLKRAKEELGAAGEEGGRALARLFDQYFSDPMTDAYLENALDAASLNPGDEAHALLLRALSHPREAVRQRAMTGFVSGRARPEDFDVFLERLAGADTRPLRALYARALFVADRERAAVETLRWMREKRNEDVWNDFVRELALARSPEATALARGIYAALDPFLGVWVAVPAAVAGDEGALAFLREERERPDPRRRLSAVEALSQGGLVDEVLAALEDPDPQVRSLAISGAVQAGTLDRRGLDRITAMLADGSPTVRALALQELCELGDEASLEQALQELGQGPEFLEEALRALVEPLKRDPALARRAYERIVERHRSEEHRPIQQRTATLKALGIVPLREAARFLREVALAAEGQTIEGLRAHEWILIQVANTGEAGRAYLLEELATERDPLRRIDLVSTIGATRDPTARDALLAFVEEGTEDSYEILYAASRLVKLGPARIVAPRLKRVATRIEDGKLRNAFHCLLWRWY